MQFHGVIVAAEDVGDIQRVEIQGAMREHHAFGRAGGTRSVKQLGDGVFVDGKRVGARQAAAGEQFFVGLPDFDGVLDFRQRRDRLAEVALVNQDARLGVVEDAGEFRRGQPHIERHYDGARQQDAEIAFQKLVIIEAQVGDAIAGLHSEGEESGRQALAALAEFPIGEAVRAAHHSDFGAIEIDSSI